MNMFGGGGGAGLRIAAVPPSVPPLGMGGGQRLISTFSTSVGLFDPSNSTNPNSKEEFYNPPRNYLSTQ